MLKKTPSWILKTDNPESLKGLNLDSFNEIMIVLSPQSKPEELAFLPTSKIRLSLPAVIRESAFKKVISSFINTGFLKWQIGNLGGLSLLPKKADISFDDTIPLLNTQSVSQAFELGASRVAFSVEDTKENIAELLKCAPQSELVVYQDTPLFLSSNCVRENDCAHCSHLPQAEEISNGSDKFLLLSKNCLTTVIKNEPFYIGDKIKDIQVPFLRIDLCNRAYTPTQAAHLIKAIQNGEKLKHMYSGNFNKQFV